jgi:hypothetical protein
MRNVEQRDIVSFLAELAAIDDRVVASRAFGVELEFRACATAPAR